MPVDLSMIGLEGIKAGQDTLDAIEARKSMAVLTQGKALENRQLEEEMALDDLASQRLSEIAGGSYKPDSTLFDGEDVQSSSARTLEIVGDTYMRGGAPKKGMEFLSEASKIRKAEADMTSAKITDQQNKLENVMKVSDFVSKSIGIARNQSEWDHGREQLRNSGLLPPDMMAKIDEMEDFTPDVAAYFNDAALNAYQRATMDLTASRDTATKLNAERRLQNSEELTTIAKRRLELAEIAAKKVAKAGKSAAAPNPQEIASATNAITSQILKGAKPKSEYNSFLEAGAQTIAARAKAMVSADRALDWDTAINRAVIESQSNGDWTPMENVSSVLGFETGREKVGSKFDPGILPQTADGKPDVSKLRKNRVYITAKGRARWNGKSFNLVQESPVEE